MVFPGDGVAGAAGWGWRGTAGHGEGGGAEEGECGEDGEFHCVGCLVLVWVDEKERQDDEMEARDWIVI